MTPDQWFVVASQSAIAGWILLAVGLFLPRRAGRSLARSYVVWVAIGSGLFELAYITWQAAQGQASHFNVGTPVAGLMYALMGVGAVQGQPFFT